ncbi:unnamed protein product [Owenia fusiformis]|uniref:Uncharacterized protein n=1 Tax=Owenia fusiformis TaxID=6347 RepID=A0A8J1U606_OWEFU|nr:unnamed protein product [Owenia fusiformis]
MLPSCVVRPGLQPMTYLVRSYVARAAKKIKPRSDRPENKHFMDFRRVHLKGGKGGNGMMSFLSLFANEFAGPDGGDGGCGGHVILQADTNVKALNHVKTEYKAADGENGKSKCCHSKNTEHTYVSVPIGTICKDESGSVVADLAKQNAIFVAARGGAGGHGNHYFLSNEKRAPTTHEMGAAGEDKHLLLELRTIAHAGLIGFPNAGKSTLLRAVSRARPKVAAYPFTTLNPHVGIVEYEDMVQVAVADIPGLIEGAHQNRGLGISFLRHIERCLCLLYVIDLSVDEPWTQLDNLKYELEQYSEGLSERRHAIIGNKIDLKKSQDNFELLKARTDLPVIAISAKKLLNIEEVELHLRQLYDNNVSQEQGDEDD